MYARNAKWAALLMSAVMVSCSQHEEFLLEGDADGTAIVTSVSLTTPEVFGASRSVPEGVYTPAGEGTTPVTLYPGRSGMSSFGGVPIEKEGIDDKGNPYTWYESISNVDLNEHPLTYTVGVYVATTTGEGDAATTTYTLVDKQALKNHADAKASFNFHLIKGRPYRIVAYADYAATEKENLETIPVTFGLNDELKDAFFASQDFVASEQLNVVLRRPFGKLRLMAGDFNTFNYNLGINYKINRVKVTYKTPHMLGSQNFNAVTGMFDNEDQTAADVEMEANPVAYAMEYDAEGRTDTAAVFTMYLPANFTNTTATEHGTLPAGSTQYIEGGEIPDSWMYPFDVTVEYEETAASGAKNLTHHRSFDVDIPVKRNWLTTVNVSEFWAETSNITVSIDHRFQGEIEFVPEGVVVKTADELQAEIDKVVMSTTTNAEGWQVGRIKLGADVDAGAKTKGRVGAFVVDTYSANKNGAKVCIYLDLNGHTISSEVVTGNPKGVISVENSLCVIHIDDSSEAATGGITYTGDADHGYPLVYCTYGGQAIINGGKFVSSSSGPAVYVCENESSHITVQRTAYAAVGISKGSEEPDDATKALIRAEMEKLSSKVVINGGWFENAQPVNTKEDEKVCINSYNVRRVESSEKPNTCWEKFKNTNAAYGEWAKWGEYPVNNSTIKGITFGYVYLNGGSYVNFNPGKGDNMAPGGETDKSWQWGMMESWVDDSKFTVHSSVVNGKPVYTVLPKTTPGQETPYNYPTF